MEIADERMALVPIAEATGAETYEASYRGVPDDVRDFCEGEWRAAAKRTLDALRVIRDALAPFGTFKDWCSEHSVDYHGFQNADQYERTKRLDLKFRSDSLLSGNEAQPDPDPGPGDGDGDEWDEDDWDDDSDLPEPEPMPVPPAPTPAPVTRAAPAMFTSNSDRWFTPPDLLAKIDAFLGGIELDPCPATGEGEDIAQDGLAIPWHGRVFCNPPYNRAVAAWIAKALGEPGITEAVFLVAARTDTDWWQAAVRGWADAVCFIDGRLRFSGSANSAPFPSALLYHGPHVGQFLSAFQHLGWTITRGGPWGSSQGEADEEDEG